MLLLEDGGERTWILTAAVLRAALGARLGGVFLFLALKTSLLFGFLVLFFLSGLRSLES